MGMNIQKWGGLTQKQQWDIIVAMRGPDCGNSEMIKWFSTGVIRYHMSPIMRVGGTVNDRLNCVVVPDGWNTGILPKGVKRDEKSAPFTYWNASHFFQHVIEAAELLELPVVYVQQEEWNKAVCGELGHHGATAALAAAITPGYEDSKGASVLKAYNEVLNGTREKLKKAGLKFDYSQLSSLVGESNG